MPLPIAAILGGAALGYIIRELLQQNGAPPTEENVSNAQAALQSNPEIAMSTRVGQSLSQLDKMPSPDQIQMVAEGGGMSSAEDINNVIDQQVNAESSPMTKKMERTTDQTPGGKTQPPAQAATPAPETAGFDMNPAGATAQTATDAGVLGLGGNGGNGLDTLGILGGLGLGGGLGAYAGMRQRASVDPSLFPGAGIPQTDPRFLLGDTSPAREGDLLGPEVTYPRTNALPDYMQRSALQPGTPIEPLEAPRQVMNPQLVQREMQMVGQLPVNERMMLSANSKVGQLPFEMQLTQGLRSVPNLQFQELLRNAVRMTR